MVAKRIRHHTTNDSPQSSGQPASSQVRIHPIHPLHLTICSTSFIPLPHLPTFTLLALLVVPLFTYHLDHSQPHALLVHTPSLVTTNTTSFRRQRSTFPTDASSRGPDPHLASPPCSLLGDARTSTQGKTQRFTRISLAGRVARGI